MRCRISRLFSQSTGRILIELSPAPCHGETTRQMGWCKTPSPMAARRNTSLLDLYDSPTLGSKPFSGGLLAPVGKSCSRDRSTQAVVGARLRVRPSQERRAGVGACPYGTNRTPELRGQLTAGATLCADGRDSRRSGGAGVARAGRVFAGRGPGAGAPARCRGQAG